MFLVINITLTFHSALETKEIIQRKEQKKMRNKLSIKYRFYINILVKNIAIFIFDSM